MAKYVDGYVLPIPKSKRDAYKKMAKDGRTVWMKFGALDYKECRADDMTPNQIVFTFPKMAKVKDGEEVWFSFVTFKSKKHRDEVNKKVMAYFDKKYANKKPEDMPLDMKRFAYGGFTVEVGA
jgi:uncharacterized protein YbaA (DUF1428 family)